MERLTLILFIIGFVFLIKGADMLVEGSSSVAKKFWISDIIIGLTIVAFGTSAPELVVNVSSSLKGATGITIGNVLGSNIANILLILGASALFAPLKVKKKLLSNEVFFTIIATVVFGIFINDRFIDGAAQGLVTRSEGLILLVLLWIFLYYVYQSIKNGKADEEEGEIKVLPVWKSLLWIVLGLGGLILGGEWIVNGAVMIAEAFGISQRVIGLTIIAIGTSLPELATSAIAAYKGKTDLALGNVIGSNIFNILFILGMSSLITPIPALAGTTGDLILLCFATGLIYVFGYGITGKKWQINKREGVLMIVLYLVYLGYLVFSTI